MDKEAILISACLLGVPCRYDGASKPCSAVEELRARYRLIPICPEQLGGLPTPRPASEIGVDGRVRNRLGADVTAEYLAGAEAALRIAWENGCRLAVLKEKSPSCGSGKVYDGSFGGKLVAGDGITVRLLRKNGIRVIGEREILDLIRENVV
ncbi:MAG TPA: purine-nucleoside phosphorylase [Clostridiales bacterium]|nr:purine-nucleoside phosphorylase [Clostridiales bacterium]